MLALKNKILSYSKVSNEEFEFAFQYYKQERIKKGDLLIKQGDVADTLYFMQKGCVVFYALINGEEKVIEFFTENDIFGDFHSYLRELPSNGLIRAVEDSAIISIKKSDFEQILQKCHAFEHFGRKFLEERLLTVLINFQNNAVLSNEERYLRLIRKRPMLFQRVPQYLIASYLGLTAVGLSKIRKRLSEK
ncbi:MAG: CRP-like cAMP-binding protein [Saprospiraceae bacterium]|jgi:CRP-like cAMP-binding protein